MIEATVLTDRFDRALLYAAHVHGGQVRNGTSTPYVAHLLAVAATVLDTGVMRGIDLNQPECLRR
jgi:GTP pyrophosphokinase